MLIKLPEIVSPVAERLPQPGTGVEVDVGVNVGVKVGETVGIRLPVAVGSAVSVGVEVSPGSNVIVGVDCDVSVTTAPGVDVRVGVLLGVRVPFGVFVTTLVTVTVLVGPPPIGVAVLVPIPSSKIPKIVLELVASKVRARNGINRIMGA